MKSIWKFPLAVKGRQDVEMPKGAEILCADKQGEVLCLWAIVDTEAEMEERLIAVVATGQEMGIDYLKYIGTAQIANGALVWHVFEVIK